MCLKMNGPRSVVGVETHLGWCGASGCHSQDYTACPFHPPPFSQHKTAQPPYPVHFRLVLERFRAASQLNLVCWSRLWSTPSTEDPHLHMAF